MEHTIVKGDAILGQYKLHAYVLMPNHVHLLVRPRIELSKLTKGIKGVSAKYANAIFCRTGKTFWQDETFDHWVRNEREYGKIRFYI